MNKPTHDVLTKYRGDRDKDGNPHVFVMSFEDVMNDRDGTKLNPDRSRLERDFSDTFDWGNDSDGCRQLAHALITEATNDETYANRHYEAFMHDFQITDPLRVSWLFGQHEIREWCLKAGYEYVNQLYKDLMPNKESSNE